MGHRHPVGMGWLQLVGSFKLQVSLAEYSLFYRALLQKRPVILRSLLIVATPQPQHQPRYRSKAAPVLVRVYCIWICVRVKEEWVLVGSEPRHPTLPTHTHICTQHTHTITIHTYQYNTIHTYQYNTIHNTTRIYTYNTYMTHTPVS